MRSGGQTTYGEGMRAYSMMSESIDAFSQATDELFDTIQEQARGKYAPAGGQRRIWINSNEEARDMVFLYCKSEKGSDSATPEMQLPRNEDFSGCRRMGSRSRKLTRISP